VIVAFSAYPVTGIVVGGTPPTFRLAAALR
jgi:hypothetical protein